MSEWMTCVRKGVIEMRRYVPGEDLSKVSVSKADDPYTDYGYIARNPDNHADLWYVAKAYAEKNYQVSVSVVPREGSSSSSTPPKLSSGDAT